MNLPVKAIVGAVLAALIVGIVLTYALSKGGFLGSFEGIAPKGYQPEDGSYLDGKAYSDLEKRRYPVLAVQDKVLEQGRGYSIDELVEKAEDADGNSLLAEVAMKGEEVEDGIFTAKDAGKHRLNFSVTDNHGLAVYKSLVAIVQEGGMEDESSD
ncbi:hypothetical protein LQZ18_17995 [Lachnospiraceae bacterium ZAX-1]